ncbi:MAG: hypothetical protein ABSD53_06780 [Terriglobales bacterium]|jgi:hypothetical protein
MRTVASTLLVSYLLLGVLQPVTAADKIKIEITETTITVGLTPRTDPGRPEHINTHCNRAGTNCDSVVTPATDPSSSLVPQILSFEAKAVFPDGSHVELMCFPSRLNKECGGVTPITGSRTESVNCFLDAMVAHAPPVGTTKTCTTQNLGLYQAKWEYDKNAERITDHALHDLRPGPDLIIYGPQRKVKYQVKGLW